MVANSAKLRTAVAAILLAFVLGGAAPAAAPPPPTTVVQLVLPKGSASPKTLVGQLAGAAANPFSQNVALLLLTALITGVAVPRVKSRMDLRYFREQKAHEADLARQNNLIAEQVEFLKAYINILWRFHFTLVEVSYEKAGNADAEYFAKVWARYGPESWACLRECRSITSSAVRLVSDQYFTRLIGFFEFLLKTEAELSYQVNADRMSVSDWHSYHQKLFYGFSARLDAEIGALARELQLTTKSPGPINAASRPPTSAPAAPPAHAAPR